MCNDVACQWCKYKYNNLKGAVSCAAWLYVNNGSTSLTPCIQLLTDTGTIPTGNLFPTVIRIPRHTICFLARKKD